MELSRDKHYVLQPTFFYFFYFIFFFFNKPQHQALVAFQFSNPLVNLSAEEAKYLAKNVPLTRKVQHSPPQLTSAHGSGKTIVLFFSKR